MQLKLIPVLNLLSFKYFHSSSERRILKVLYLLSLSIKVPSKVAYIHR